MKYNEGWSKKHKTTMKDWILYAHKSVGNKYLLCFKEF